jgi:hypothetical protein
VNRALAVLVVVAALCGPATPADDPLADVRELSRLMGLRVGTVYMGGIDNAVAFKVLADAVIALSERIDAAKTPSRRRLQR